MYLQFAYSVNLNGTQIGPISPSRGLRQGDPLSPYPFLLCVERLPGAIKRSAEQGKITRIKIHPQAPAITHLFFCR